MKIKLTRILLSAVVITALMITGCSKDKASSEPTTENNSSEEEKDKKGLFDASFTPETAIAYSAGDDSNWSYGNQRKEFPIDDKCYVRIACKVITDKKSGADEEISVTYRFTGTENCAVNLSDGNAELVESNDPNVTEYKSVIYAKKKKNAEESVIIFQYVPTEEAEGITLEVLYDDNIDARYDSRNAVYFTSAEASDSSDEKKDKGIN